MSYRLIDYATPATQQLLLALRTSTALRLHLTQKESVKVQEKHVFRFMFLCCLLHDYA